MAAALRTIAVVVPAELPDKTMVATLIMVTRTRRPLAVWVGAVCGFSLQVLVAVAVGSALSRLPRTPVGLLVAALFFTGAVLMWRDGNRETADAAAGADLDAGDSGADGVPRAPAMKVVLQAAGVIALAEFGDLTQIATAGVAASTSEPVGVAVGALAGLAFVAGIAVTIGRLVIRYVPLHLVRRGAVVVMAVLGTLTLIETLRG